MSKVVVIKCSSYDEDEVYNKIKKAVEDLGGIKNFIKEDENILLKPNILAPVKPEQGVTTHPAVFKAVAKILLENNYKNIKYGDSPGGGPMETAARMSGIAQCAKKLGIAQADFSDGSNVEFKSGNICRNFYIAKGVQQSDCIISISKLKTHQLTMITGAVKNQFGCVYGKNKAAFHKLFKDRLDFCKMLIDLNLLLKPRLYIMDAVVSMEGNGPFAGNPVHTNAILLSADPVALDYTACKLIGVDPDSVQTIVLGKKYGLGEYGNSVEIRCEDVFESLVNKNFKRVKTNVMEKIGKKLFGNMDLFRKVPVIDKKLCTGCGKCVEICPVESKAVCFKEKGVNPDFKYHECIKCYCCQETCPKKAISIKFTINSDLGARIKNTRV